MAKITAEDIWIDGQKPTAQLRSKTKIVDSVKKTGRCVIVHEATRTSGFGAELTALVQEHCFFHLEAPVERVTGWDTPYPHALEWAYFPGPKRVGEAFRKVMGKDTA